MSEMDRPVTSKVEIERLAHRIVENVPMAVLGLDERAKVRFANRAALKLLDWNAQPLIGQDVLQGFGWPTSLQIALAGPPTGERRLAFTWKRPDGSVDLGMTVVRLRDPELALSVILVFRELDSIGRGERDMLRLERAAAVGRLAKGLAHEIRNPLAVIQGLSENLVAELHPDQQSAHECARRIVPQVQRIDGLVRACMDFSLPKRPHKRRCDPIAIVMAALGDLAARWKDTGEGPRTRFAESIPDVWADPRQIQTILTDLVDNALDSTMRSQAVEVAVLCTLDKQDGVLIEVKDEGQGIPEGQLDRVFEPFFTTKHDTFGLSLTRSQALALQNDALLEVRSKPGETVFGLVLPLADKS